MAEILHINRKQGAVLSSIELTSADQAKNYDYIGVEFEEGEKEKLVEELVEKGLLELRDKKLVPTTIGKTVMDKFDIVILKED